MWDNLPGSLPLSSGSGRGCQNNATLLAYAPHGSQHCGSCAHLPIPSVTQGSSDCTDCQGYLVIYGPSWTLMDISAEGPMSPMASASSLGFNSFADTFLFKSSPHAWWKLNGCFLPQGEPCVTDGVPVLPWHPVHGTNGCHWWGSQTHWSRGVACTAGWGTCLITFVIVANAMSIQKDSQFLSVIFLHSLYSEEVYLCLPTPSKICLLHFLTPEQHSIYKHGASRPTWITPSLALCDLGPYISIRHRCTFETALTGSCPLKRIYLTYTKTPLRNKHFN